MPRVTKKSIMERKFNKFFKCDSTSEESSTEEEILPPKKQKLNDDPKLKQNNIKPEVLNDEDQENNAPGIDIMLHQLPGDKQKSLKTKNYKKEHYNEETAYVESVEAACHSQVESSLKLSFEYQKCIESKINNMVTSAAQDFQTEEAVQSKSVHSYLRYLKKQIKDQIGDAESLLELQTSYRKKFKDSEKKLKEEAKAMQNDVEKQYMGLQEKIKNHVKEEELISIRKVCRNLYKL